MSAAQRELKHKLATLPDTPGVYLLKDARGAVLYVGKAKSLRARVRSYFNRSGDGRRMLPFLRAKLEDVDTLTVNNEKEAFLLENNLIKQHKPRYNVRLVDDKTYLSLRLNRSHAFPRFTTVRQRRADGSRYFGPYSSARAVRSTLKLIYRNFGIRSCSDAVLQNRTRPCLYYQIGQCLAPCVDYVSEADYADALGQAELFLAGDSARLVGRLETEMQAHADAERFEDAAKTRDKIRAVERTLEGQDMSLARDDDFDVVGHGSAAGEHIFVWLYVRDGRVIDTTTTRVRDRSQSALPELFASVLAQVYDSRPVPAEILVPALPNSSELVEQVLADRRGRRVRIRKPMRGSKRRLLDIAIGNAVTTATARATNDANTSDVLAALQELLGLPEPPRRIECFDISHLGGGLAVGSMTVAIDGRLAKSEYRRYRIKEAAGGDDYASMREVLSRRLTRALDDGTVADLMIVDGGPGQVSIASSVLEELGVEGIGLIGLAKGPERNAGRETIHTTDGAAPLALPHADERLHFLQRVRDEAHRFAVTYQRKLRKKRDLTSALTSVPGVGPKRAKALLIALGSLDEVRKASAEQLAGVPGIDVALAERILAHLATHDG